MKTLPPELYQALPGMSRAAVAQHAQEFLQHAQLAGTRQARTDSFQLLHSRNRTLRWVPYLVFSVPAACMPAGASWQAAFVTELVGDLLLG